MDNTIEQLKYLSNLIVGVVFAMLLASFVLATGLQMSLSGSSMETVILLVAVAAFISCGAIHQLIDSKHFHAFGCFAIGFFFVLALKHLPTLQVVL